MGKKENLTILIEYKLCGQEACLLIKTKIKESKHTEMIRQILRGKDKGVLTNDYLECVDKQLR